MHNQNIDADVIELPQTPKNVFRVQLDSAGHGDIETANDGLLATLKDSSGSIGNSQDTVPREKRWPSWMLFWNTTELIYFLAVIVTAIPIVLLATYAPRLSAKLGSQACLPNGDFVLPGTASIWNPAYFFTISITTKGTNSDWRYTHVKIIDVLWDVAVGRGGQLLLIYVAYHVFSQSLAHVMETRTVSYQAYSAVAFESTSLRSIWHYLWSIDWYSHSDRSWRSWHIFVSMALASLYVAAMPTLFSAMTGYAAVFAPSLEMPPKEFEGDYICQDLGGCSVFPCGGGAPGDSAKGEGLVPGWGVVLDSMRIGYGSPLTMSVPYAYGSNGKGVEYYVRQYYERHEAAYNALKTDPACHNVSSLRDCPATNIESVLSEPGYNRQLEAPLLKIQLWGNESTTGRPKFWLCENLIINTKDFNIGNVTGICNAAPNVFTGTSYQWGFSFLLLLLVCILNTVFAALVYGLWIDARRHPSGSRIREKKVDRGGHVRWRAVDYPSVMSSVMRIAAQARDDHGEEVLTWNSKKLDKKVWQGKRGIRNRKPILNEDVTRDG